MAITHTVLFQFKDTSPEDLKAMCERFASLKEGCRHPSTGREYIQSVKGGRDNSPEGLQEGLTHAFVLEFASVEHRDWYVKLDPVHAAFMKSIEGVVERAVVVDFVEGVY
ncbi:hypothetical protein B0T25DRAFT_570858 [Lasiosphaeria hispida]|uniref:Stress-response A/B barrel domain-containing protein n=1 Tax=Lasiosphaeria hispida TaxID=260671 RepID=A0AAJ0HGA3_9PEZI|nr:hypothetical protein B0T25DRAFT_570858 [Lasiosphaeria hispida]